MNGAERLALLLRINPALMREVLFTEVLVVAQEELSPPQVQPVALVPEEKAAFMQSEAVVQRVHLVAMDQQERVRRTLCAEMEVGEEQPTREQRTAMAVLAVVVLAAAAVAQELMTQATLAQAERVETAW